MQKVMPLMWVFMVMAGCSMKTQKQEKQLWQSWSDVQRLSTTSSKPIFIDIYTDWCRYCKIMDATTFKNDSVVHYLKANFLRFKFNAEGKDTVVWRDKKFAFNPRYDVHDFAVYLTRGSVVYPTTVIITPGGQPFFKHGEIKVGEMEMLLKYFNEGVKQKLSLEEFAGSFSPGWK